ncbi:MAG: tyrosine-type recombinase/integrase [Acidaminococcaceae bacterium]|nr:tyrosine-type recombinase/integrase [Acidaminococcaceae bacterium]
MKRANKTGSIVKRNDKKRRRPYCVYLDGGMDPDTFKRKRIFLGSFAKHSEAQDFLEKYRHGLVTAQPAKEVTLTEIWKLYKGDREALTGKPLSPNYVHTWNRYIAPKLGAAAVSGIKTMHMQNCINFCTSVVTQKHMKSIFKGLFTYAMANDLAAKDYADALKTQPKEKSEKHKPFTTEELRWLWANSDNELYQIILIQTYTGLRKTELASMRMEDVHLAGRYMVGGEKTAAGKNRVVPIADCIFPFVQHFYDISLFVHHPYLIMPDKDRYLLKTGDLVNIDTLYRKHFNGHVTHDARHTFITMASNYGLAESVVKKIVGHQTTDITSDIYTHKSTKQLLDAVNILPHGPNMTVSPEEVQGSHRVATG